MDITYKECIDELEHIIDWHNPNSPNYHVGPIVLREEVFRKAIDSIKTLDRIKDILNIR